MIKRISAAAIAVILLSAALPLFAQDEQPVPPAATLFVEQTSDIAAVGKWTLLQPTHESFDRTDATLEVPNLLPGRYTFFSEPPSGTDAHIDLFLGDDVIASSETPQLTFELQDKMTAKLKIHYTLTTSGKIGINSEPTRMPFELRGPDGLQKAGVTPTELSPMPIGNYSVTFKPEGCLQPPAQAGSLIKNGRIDFMLKLSCEAFIPVPEEEKSTTVTTDIGGTVITFDDVPSDSWFGPYVLTIAKRGIMSGYADARGNPTNTFGPGDPVTVAQLAKITHTLMKESVSGITMAPKNPRAQKTWASAYMASAEDRGWLVYFDGTVDPDRPATRGEVLVTLLQGLDIPAHWPKGKTFTDVLRSTPHAGAIETAAEEGIVSGKNGDDGKPTGLFEPLAPVTRAEIAKILITVREKYQNRDEE